MCRVSAFWCVCLLLVFSVTQVEARPERVTQIPNGNTFGCANCHVNPAGGGARNAFGQEVENGFLSNSGTVVWNATLASRDSDGDKVTNGQELGDPDGDGTPTAGATVTNPGNASSLPQVTNRAPVFTAVPNKTVNEGVALTFQVQATDADNDAVTIAATGLPTGATFANGTFLWTPSFSQSGSVTVNFSASDGKTQTALSVQIAVANVNRVPVLADVSAKTGKVGEALTFQVQATDADNDVVTITATGLPTGATFASGAFSWTPTTGQNGVFNVLFIASDGTGQDSLTVAITIAAAVQPLAISSFLPNKALVIVASGDTLRFSVVASSGAGTMQYAWTLNGTAQTATSASFLLTATSGNADDVVGVTVSDGSTKKVQSWTVSKSLKGDVDGNNRVDFADFLSLAASFGKGTGETGYVAKADIDSSGRVDFADFLTFVRFFGQSK